MGYPPLNCSLCSLLVLVQVSPGHFSCIVKCRGIKFKLLRFSLCKSPDWWGVWLLPDEGPREAQLQINQLDRLYGYRIGIRVSSSLDACWLYCMYILWWSMFSRRCAARYISTLSGQLLGAPYTYFQTSELANIDKPRFSWYTLYWVHRLPHPYLLITYRWSIQLLKKHTRLRRI